MRYKFALIVIFCAYSFAYRPFYTSDASVEERGHYSLEWGFFEFQRYDNVDEVTLPSLVLNVGLGSNLEIDLEADLIHKGEKSELDKSLVLKWVHSGRKFSFGFEFTPIEGGGNLNFLLSLRRREFACHFNAAAGTEGRRFLGFILERTLSENIRIVGEYFYNKEEGNEDKGFLLGVIHSYRGVDFDLGVRKFLSHGYSITMGATIEF